MTENKLDKIQSALERIERKQDVIIRKLNIALAKIEQGKGVDGVVKEDDEEAS